MTSPHALDWYVLVVPAKRELDARDLIRDTFGIETFVPVEIKWRRYNRRRKKRTGIAYPILQRYVFAGFSPGQVPPWYDLANLEPPVAWRAPRAVIRVLGHNGAPVRLPPGDIAMLKRLGDDPMIHHTAPNPHKAFRVGDAAMIAGGPLAGHIVSIEAIVANRARAIIRWFNTRQEIDLPLESLEAA